MKPAARPYSHAVQRAPAGVSAVLPRILPLPPTLKNNERTCSSLTFTARRIGRLMMIPSCNIPKSGLMFRSTLHIPAPESWRKTDDRLWSMCAFACKYGLMGSPRRSCGRTAGAADVRENTASDFIIAPSRIPLNAVSEFDSKSANSGATMRDINRSYPRRRPYMVGAARSGVLFFYLLR